MKILLSLIVFLLVCLPVNANSQERYAPSSIPIMCVEGGTIPEKLFKDYKENLFIKGINFGIDEMKIYVNAKTKSYTITVSPQQREDVECFVFSGDEFSLVSLGHKISFTR